MANCPNCGSSHINIKRETNVSWGRAVAGWALLGAVGGAVGAITGEDRNVNACLDCGTSWKAADLYKILQTIKSTASVTLDLAREQDRAYMNNFVVEVGPFLEAIPQVERKGEKFVAEVRTKFAEQAATGCGLGCAGSLIGCFTIASMLSGFGLLAMFILPPLIGWGLGLLMDKVNKETANREIAKARKEADSMKLQAEENLVLALAGFKDKHSL
jgi:hypothetical protein